MNNIAADTDLSEQAIAVCLASGGITMIKSYRVASLLLFAVFAFSIDAAAQSIAIGRSSLALPEPMRWSVSEIKSPGVPFTGDRSGNIPLDGKILVYRPGSGAIKAIVISHVTKGGVTGMAMRWQSECASIAASQFLYKRDRSSSDDVDCLVVTAIAGPQQFVDDVPLLKNHLGGLIPDGNGIYYVSHLRSVGAGGIAISQVLISQDFKGLEGVAVEHGTQLQTTVLAWAEQFARGNRDAILSFSGNWSVPPLSFGSESDAAAAFTPPNWPQRRGFATPPSMVAPTHRGVIGTLVMTDTLTGRKSTLDVTAQQLDAETTLYSTGDMIAKNGKVLQVRVGDTIVRGLSGALWTIPLVAGTSGQARFERVDVAARPPGELRWNAIATGDGKVRIEANVYYKTEGSAGWANASGKWTAVYSGGQLLPDTVVAVIRAQGNSVSHNLVSSELKWH